MDWQRRYVLLSLIQYPLPHFPTLVDADESCRPRFELRGQLAGGILGRSEELNGYVRCLNYNYYQYHLHQLANPSYSSLLLGFVLVTTRLISNRIEPRIAERHHQYAPVDASEECGVVARDVNCGAAGVLEAASGFLAHFTTTIYLNYHFSSIVFAFSRTPPQLTMSSNPPGSRLVCCSHSEPTDDADYFSSRLLSAPVLRYPPQPCS